MDQKYIRNFSIIAHIDHGKSTLADRLLEVTGTTSKRQMKAQLLDSMDLEQERGITIKLHPARMMYKAEDGNEYMLNLIDTPGHVDFTYEVSRSLAACEGALLVVDATQGIEAQTLANIYLAIENDLTIMPVINKIDLPAAEPEKVMKEVEAILGPSDYIPVSAKTGVGVKNVLEAIVNFVPQPKGEVNKPLKALVFDSHFDSYRGVEVMIRVIDGSIKEGQTIKFMQTDAEYDITEIGYFKPSQIRTGFLNTGEVGYLIGNIKNIENVKIGDTITLAGDETEEALPGYKEPQSMVFCGLYPVSSDDYEDLRDALQKLKLNDSSLRFEPETSKALGFGFRCGFLGLLHMEIIKERIEREFNIEMIATSPGVVYHITLTNGEKLIIDNPANYPERGIVEIIEEPIAKANIILPNEYVGAIMDLCNRKRGKLDHMEYLTEERIMLYYRLPLNEIVVDFFGQLKSLSKGYASLDYELAGYESSDLVKVDILLKSDLVDAFSFICHKDHAYFRGRAIVKKLRELIPRQMFEIPIQASIGSKIISRETIKALRKNVTAKCYGGDISRKRKLLEKQKEGKKRMKSVGSVEIPDEAFMSILSIEDEK
ncbi:MAG: translation elongation factor 4 [Candidatus Margulisbacteria bacterium]|nr:translation elongation factor 4 [Candidatus Margulisiibacteriota bacterium]